MHRRVRFRVAVLGSLFLIALKLSGCDTTDPPTPTSVVVNPTTVNLDAIGATQQLSAEVLDQRDKPMPDEPITWASDDTTIARVSTNGLVTAVRNGVTDVRASSNALSASAEVTVAQVATSLVKLSGDGQTGLVGFAVNIPPAVLVTDASGFPTRNVTVTFTVTGGGGSVTGGTAQTDSSGIARVGRWELGGAPGPNSLDATNPTAGTVVFTATGAAAAYDIDVRFLTSVTPSQEQAFLEAAARWGELIFGDLSNILVQVPDSTCGDNSPAIDEVVDDLLIFATVDSIDGPDGILGQAGPCLIRSSNRLPVVGVMIFDEADLAELETIGHLDEVILHEMGHVIGLGTLWPFMGFVDTLAADPHFNGARAIEAFDRNGGATYTGNKVPVEDQFGSGTRFGHWRESVFDTELLTGILDGGVENPLSEVTTASFWDMGYLVNLDGSDAYSLPMMALRIAGGATVELVDDILNLPIYVVDSGGRVVDVIPRR